MAKIDVVIRLDESDYKAFCGECYYLYTGLRSGKTLLGSIIRALKNGTPLPKGHGRLIDADAFRLYCFRKNWDRRLSAGGLATINMYLDSGAPTIIEADKESEE